MTENLKPQEGTDPDILQALDLEENCFGLYTDNNFIFKDFEKSLKMASLAWKHSPLFENDEDLTYIHLYSKNRSISEFGPNPEALQEAENLIKAHRRACLEAKVDLAGTCFFEAVPEHLMSRWFSLRDSAIRSILSKTEKPKDYSILHKAHVLATNINRQKIIIDGEAHRVQYDILSSATGRFTTTKGTYPILSMDKKQRCNLTPQNDLFLEIDLNGAEIRTLLALSGVDQPQEDIHMWNMKNALPPWISRPEAKEHFFAWLYNPKNHNEDYEKFYNKKVYREYYDGKAVKTPFGRVLEVDERKALNYLTQSTTNDIVVQSCYKIMKFLKGKKSTVAFTMHDSVVLDFAKEDHHLVSEIKEIFETNLFGRFLSTVKIGKNFGELKEITV
jgi:hypothetical protein